MAQDNQSPHPSPGTDNHCADHKRDVWKTGDKKSLTAWFNWHRWCPFENRPTLRWVFLIGLAVLVVAVLIVGIVFTVYYDAMYYSSGAFLLHKTEGAEPEDARDSVLTAERGVDVDPNVCGEKRDSCQAFGQPNICCPVGIVCHASSFSPSGVYCCTDGPDCVATEAKPPRCDDHTVPCDKSLGGGCCARGTECAATGCLKVYRAEPGFETWPPSGTEKPHSATTAAANTHSGALPSSKTTWVGEAAATEGAMVVTTKIGETAQSLGLKGVGPGFGFSSCLSLEVLALGFGVVFSLGMVLLG
ncbi:hypothetical protein F5Y04DRAFT_291928 [Hypomontagnella monticulosa]|nr:hypothetical protein F5Y04DRAFT_291928 [Hypomontagnella monticulosa]